MDQRSEIKVSDANIAPFQLGDERQFLAHGFVTTVVGTGTFNFWQNAAKRGSFL